MRAWSVNHETAQDFRKVRGKKGTLGEWVPTVVVTSLSPGSDPGVGISVAISPATCVCLWASSCVSVPLSEKASCFHLFTP